jgi:hypothetical protein
MPKRKIATIDEFEGKSGELVRTAFALCEASMKGTDRHGPKLPQKALAAAAESLRESAKTFAAVAKVCNNSCK